MLYYCDNFLMPASTRRLLLFAPLVLGASAIGAASAWATPAGRVATRPAGSAPRPRLVVLDPGHGGADPGALGATGVSEKSVVMAVAQELKRQLEVGGRYRVALTRAGDQFVPLRDRVQRAQAARAELFLSLHADSHPDPSVRGASVYTLSEDASDREAAALAQRENRADAQRAGLKLGDQPDQVARVLVAMSQRGTVNESRRFAETIVRTFSQQGVRLLPRTHRQAGFAVLTAPEIPAALVELGYLSNRQDEKLLSVRQHQIHLARALRASIEAHLPPLATRKA